jgi:hypothetical protein
MMMDREFRRTSTMRGTLGGDLLLQSDLDKPLIPKPSLLTIDPAPETPERKSSSKFRRRKSD